MVDHRPRLNTTQPSEWLQRLCLFWISPTLQKSMSQPLWTVKHVIYQLTWSNHGENTQENNCFWSSQSSRDVISVHRWNGENCEQLEFSTYHDFRENGAAPRTNRVKQMAKLNEICYEAVIEQVRKGAMRDRPSLGMVHHMDGLSESHWRSQKKAGNSKFTPTSSHFNYSFQEFHDFHGAQGCTR